MDSYSIRITRQAKEHLVLIKEYIATELKEPSTAKRLLERFKKKIQTLGTFPY